MHDEGDRQEVTAGSDGCVAVNERQTLCHRRMGIGGPPCATRGPLVPSNFGDRGDVD